MTEFIALDFFRLTDVKLPQSHQLMVNGSQNIYKCYLIQLLICMVLEFLTFIYHHLYSPALQSFHILCAPPNGFGEVLFHVFILQGTTIPLRLSLS